MASMKYALAAMAMALASLTAPAQQPHNNYVRLNLSSGRHIDVPASALESLGHLPLASAADLSLDGLEPGGLADACTDYNTGAVTSLTIAGTLSADDMAFIRLNFPALSSLNLADASFADNALPAGALCDTVTGRGMISLQTLTLPRNTESIGHDAFRGCFALQSVSIPNPIPPALGNDAFEAISPDAALSVPMGTGHQFADSFWSDYFRIIDSYTGQEVLPEKLCDDIFRFSLGEYPAVGFGQNSRTVNVRVPYGTDLSALTASFRIKRGCSLSLADAPFTADETVADYSSPLPLTLTDPYGRTETYYVAASYSAIPVVYINTPGSKPVNSKYTYVADTEIFIVNTEYDDHLTEAQIKGRGNTTWEKPKKPYALKLKKKAPVLGMPKHKRWVLLANYIDRTLMRNAVAFEMARNTGMAWTPSGDFVDVVLNGRFLGNYYLCEQIKIDENRLDITQMTSEDIDEETITGGYLLELDDYYDEVNKFRTNHGSSKNTTIGMPVMFKDPDEDVLTPEQFEYMKDYFLTAEETLYTHDVPLMEEYAEYLDVDSFIDWWLIYEVTRNGEACWPKSCYMHKDRGGKLTAGPIWDFDYGTFTNVGGWKAKDYIWYPQLFKDPAFVARVKERWTELYPKFNSHSQFIISTANRIKASQEYNFSLWPIDTLHTNGDEQMTFDNAILRMRLSIINRLSWLNEQIKNM